MEPYIADLPITVDLDVIARYHSVTKLKVGRLNNADVQSDNYADSIKVFVIKHEGDLHPAFDYWKYAKDAGLNESKANHLLYLIYQNCLYEWGVYYESLGTNNSSKSISIVSDNPMEFNLVQHAREELRKIQDLCLLLESHSTETDISFSYRSGINKNGKAARKTYKLVGVEIDDRAQVVSVLRYTIDLLFKTSQEGFNEILGEALKGKHASYNTITEAIRNLPILPSKYDDAISAFRKYLINLCLDFIKQETNVNINIQTIPKEEVLMLYSLFSLLRLIDPSLILKHKTTASRAKYIRSMAFNTANIRRGEDGKPLNKMNFFQGIEFCEENK